MANRPAREEFRIGPFVLETLTTGLYAESRNALREYVQNAYDAIRSAVSIKLIGAGAGRVNVLLPDDDTLVIEDNGVGLSEASAWATLTAIGASKKDRRKDAGFRGIGRLAGIAFCNELSFRTKVSGEETETVVTFDCRALRKGMASGSSVTSLSDLLRGAVTSSSNDDVDPDDHYMVVTLRGLARAPQEFKEIDDTKEYLSETSPIQFKPDWTRGAEIRRYARKLGKTIHTIELYVGQSAEDAEQVFKPYGDAYRKARATRAQGGMTSLERIEFFSGQHQRWWGWIGVPRDSGTLADELTSGVRVRVNNIQIDAAGIFDRIFAERNESYGRFNRFYVGEVYVDADAIVPNARRDGFEDDEGWRKLRRDLYVTLCEPLAQDAYARSDKGRKSVDSIKAKVERLHDKIESHLERDPRPRTAWAALITETEKLRTQIASAIIDSDPEASLPLRIQLDAVKELKDRLENKFDPEDAAQIRRKIRDEILEQVEQVLQPYMDTVTYNRVRKILHQRVK